MSAPQRSHVTLSLVGSVETLMGVMGLGPAGGGVGSDMAGIIAHGLSVQIAVLVKGKVMFHDDAVPE